MLSKIILPLLTCVILFAVGYQWLQTVKIESQSTHFTGKYVLNADSSNLRGIKLSTQDGVLGLEIYKNGTFKLSHKPAFFNCDRGSWEMEGVDGTLSIYCILTFENSNSYQFFEIDSYKSIGVNVGFPNTAEMATLRFDKISYE